MDKYLIYGLFCPFTDSLHYVGKSTTGMLRPLQHMTSSHSEKINEWVTQLKFLGYLPIIKILEKCTNENIDIKEIEWINKSINNGCYLLNVYHNLTDNIFLQKEYLFDDSYVFKIAKVVKETRLSKDISADELSRIAGISRPTLVSIEKGHKQVTLSNLNNVLTILGLEIEIKKKNEENGTPPLNAQNEPRVRVTWRKNKISKTS